jgi:hypothetical protein
MNIAAQASDQVDYIDGKTRLYGIVGDPIEQVRSPEMVTWDFRSSSRAHPAKFPDRRHGMANTLPK